MSAPLVTVPSMDLELAGHRALVSGASAGIGTAVAGRLADEGCAVLVHGRDSERSHAVARRLGETGVDVDVVVGDLTDRASADLVAERALGWGVDILVNNAGPFREDDWDTAEPDAWLRAMSANVVSAAQLTRGLVPAMRERGWGRVVTLGSRAATTPLPNMVTYSAAKAAVVNLTTSLAKHLAGSGVTANCVSPGVIVTDGMKRMFEARVGGEGGPAAWTELEAQVVAEYAPNPSGRLGTAQDVAAAVVFLASPLAGYVNGVNLRVDGGITGVP